MCAVILLAVAVSRGLCIMFSCDFHRKIHSRSSDALSVQLLPVRILCEDFSKVNQWMSSIFFLSVY